MILCILHMNRMVKKGVEEGRWSEKFASRYVAEDASLVSCFLYLPQSCIVTASDIYICIYII